MTNKTFCLVKSGKCGKTGKKRYRTSQDAALALAQTRGVGGERRRETRYYRCPFCDGWHLTSSNRRSEEHRNIERRIDERFGRGVINDMYAYPAWMRLHHPRPCESHSFLIAGLCELSKAGVPDERLADKWVWRALRSTVTKDMRGIAMFHVAMRPVAEALGASYAAEHERMVPATLAEPLTVGRLEALGLEDSLVSEWIVRAVVPGGGFGVSEAGANGLELSA